MKEPQQMFQLVTGYWVSQMMGAAARLGVADRLSDGARTSDELAALVKAEPAALYRLLRGCASVGVFSEAAGRRFSNSPLSMTLRSNVPGSMRDFAIAQTSPGHWLPWGQLHDGVKEGTRRTQAALGQEIFGWYATHPEEAAAFTGAMHNLSSQVASEVARVWDFKPGMTVVDVGGAQGTLVCAVLGAHPKTNGVLFDLPHVIAHAKPALASLGLQGRCEAIAGDFFKAVPKSDVCVLKQILHDWDDAQCVALLKNCVASLGDGGRVLVVEMVIPDDGSPSPAQLMDLNMLVMLPGRERTRSEYGALLSAAGLKLESVTATHSPFSIVSASRAA